jgi:hypothetical protein
MSITDPTRQTTNRANAAQTPERAPDAVRAEKRETKPSPRTTELWITVIGVALLAVIYNASRDASLTLFRACLLGTVMASAYIISRGFAKAGSRDDDFRAADHDRRR